MCVLQDSPRLRSTYTGQSIGEILNSHDRLLRQGVQLFIRHNLHVLQHTQYSLFFLSPQYVDTPDIYGLSPLMNACRLGNARFPRAQSARLLLAYTVPHFSHRIAELLLDLGADKEYCNKAGKTR